MAEDAAMYRSAYIAFLNGSAAISLDQGISLPVGLPREKQQTAPLCGVFRGSCVPANSYPFHSRVSIDSATCKALGVVSPVSLYHHKDVGWFICQDVSNDSNSCTPTAPPSTANPERYEPTLLSSFVTEGINDLAPVCGLNQQAGIGVSMSINNNGNDGDDEDGRKSVASSYASSTGGTSQTKRAPKKPPLTDTFKLRAMQGDCSRLNMEELRSVMGAAGRVILGVPLSTRKIKWDKVKVAFTQHSIDPARCHEPNNRDKSAGESKPNQEQLLDMAVAVKSILDEKCMHFPDYMKLYERVAEKKFAFSIQVYDSDSDTVEGVKTSMVPVPPQHNKRAMKRAVAQNVNEHNQLLAACPPSHAQPPVCKKREQPATSSLQWTRCQDDSAGVVSSASLSSNFARPFFDKPHAPVGEDDKDRSYFITTSQPDYMRRGLGWGEIYIPIANSIGNLTDIHDISNYAHAAPGGQSSYYTDYDQNNAALFGEMMAPVHHTPAAYGELLGKFQDNQRPSFSQNYSDNYNTMQIDGEIVPAFEGLQSEEFNQPLPSGGEKENGDDFGKFENEIDEICQQLFGGGTQVADHGMEITEAHDPRPPPSQVMLENPQALLDIHPVAQMTEETPLEKNGLSGSCTSSFLDDTFMNFGD
jgi:hypothetical protein